jgi:hypothetical protein
MCETIQRCQTTSDYKDQDRWLIRLESCVGVRYVMANIIDWMTVNSCVRSDTANRIVSRGAFTTCSWLQCGFRNDLCFFFSELLSGSAMGRKHRHTRDPETQQGLYAVIQQTPLKSRTLIDVEWWDRGHMAAVFYDSISNNRNNHRIWTLPKPSSASEPPV